MKLVTDPTDNKIVEYMTTTISDKLRSDETVLWLVPGGSAMNVAVKVLTNLEDEDTSLLCITLTDERFGRPGHDDENWVQLEKLGFNTRSINAYRVLRGEDSETTAIEFSNKLEQMYASFDYKIGLFGMGADGHTAGIKPESPAVSSGMLAASYVGDDFERVTMTPYAISQLDEVVLYAHGPDKFEQIRHLLETNQDIEDQPAQVLKQVKTATIFTDYK